MNSVIAFIRQPLPAQGFSATRQGGLADGVRAGASCFWGAAVLMAVLAGCGQNQIKVYRVAKEQPQPQGDTAAGAAAAAMPPGHPDISGAGPSLKWKLPAGWEETTPGEMRLASFKVRGDGGKQADVGVFPPGIMGTDADNVNRWRGQVGQPPVSADDLKKQAQPVEVAGQAAQLYEQAGENPSSGEKTRILGAILHRGDTAWFFKMNGDDALVAQQKPAFIEFLKSLTFAAPAASTALPPSHPPIGAGAPPPGQGVVPASSGGDKPTWQVPAGWQEIPGGQFLVAKFTIAGSDNSQAAVNVSMSAGEGGGVAMNVNRWRGQLGLGQMADTELNKAVTSVDTPGGKAMFVDMTGTDGRTGQKARLVGAIIPQAGQTWFYKLMGSETVVAAQKDAFTKFVQTAQYPK